MIDLIKPYPGEDDISFTKRKAYYIRIVKRRLNYGDRVISLYSPNGIPITESEREDIDAFWEKYFSPELRDIFVDYRCYYVFKNVKNENQPLNHYIPDTFYYAFIDDYFTNPQHSRPCDDKNLYDLYFHDINRPVTVFRKTNGFILDGNYHEISLRDAINKCKEEKEVILKKGKFSEGGRGIIFWNAQQQEDDLLTFLEESQDVVCERIIKQHAELSRINPTSVNTVRIMTLSFRGKVHVLSSVLRMGVNGARVDNASQGGIVCGVNPDGQLKKVAFNTYAMSFYRHPQGVEFESVTIPNFSECVELVTVLAKRFSSLSRLISWDLAIDEFGHPMLIEFNLSYGELDFHQFCNGPIFGDLTEDVLEEVFNNSYTLKSILKSFNHD